MLKRGRNIRVTESSLHRGMEKVLLSLVRTKEISKADKKKIQIKVALISDKYKF
jgi:hypothetical protein